MNHKSDKDEGNKVFHLPLNVSLKLDVLIPYCATVYYYHKRMHTIMKCGWPTYTKLAFCTLHNNYYNVTTLYVWTNHPGTRTYPMQ